MTETITVPQSIECPSWCSDHFLPFNPVGDDQGFHETHVSQLVRIVEGAAVGMSNAAGGITLEPLQDDLVGDATEARQLAAELIAAADKLDQINAEVAA